MNINSRTKGILCVISAAFCFALMNLFIRLSGDIPTMQKCFFRNAIAAVIAFFAIIKTPAEGGVKGKLILFRPKPGNLKYLFLRAFCGMVGLICNFYAVDHMNISDASMLNKLSPFFAIIFSCFILHEYADRVEWALVFLAFGGAVLVVKPGFSSEIFPAVLGVLGGLGAGVAYTFVRKLGQRGENSSLIVLFFSVFSCLVLLPFVIAVFAPMSGRQLIFLILTGAAAAGGQFSITAAYTHAPAKEISVFDYSQVIFAALLGFLFLEQIPDWLSIIGYIVIIAAAVIKWKYGLDKSRREAAE